MESGVLSCGPVAINTSKAACRAWQRWSMKFLSLGYGLRTDLKQPSITARHFQQVSISTAATHDTHHAKHYPWATAERWNREISAYMHAGANSPVSPNASFRWHLRPVGIRQEDMFSLCYFFPQDNQSWLLSVEIWLASFIFTVSINTMLVMLKAIFFFFLALAL